MVGGGSTILILALVLAPQIKDSANLSVTSMGTAAAFLLVGTALFATTFLTSKETVHREVERVTFKQTVQTVRRNGPLLRLCASSFFFLTGQSALAALGIYIANYVLRQYTGAGNWLATVVMIITSGAVLYVARSGSLRDHAYPGSVCARAARTNRDAVPFAIRLIAAHATAQLPQRAPLVDVLGVEPWRIDRGPTGPQRDAVVPCQPTRYTPADTDHRTDLGECSALNDIQVEEQRPGHQFLGRRRGGTSWPGGGVLFEEGCRVAARSPTAWWARGVSGGGPPRGSVRRGTACRLLDRLRLRRPHAPPSSPTSSADRHRSCGCDGSVSHQAQCVCQSTRSPR